jgi:hypothetical protein
MTVTPAGRDHLSLNQSAAQPPQDELTYLGDKNSNYSAVGGDRSQPNKSFHKAFSQKHQLNII